MIHTRSLYLLGSFTLLLFLLFSVVPWHTEAQEAHNEVIPARLEMLVYPPATDNSNQLATMLNISISPRSTNASPAYHPPHTTLVYENFEAGNREIYKNTPQQAHINLTNHPASDIHPRLNHGSTHVVFASNRDGSYEIYKMAIDGGQLTRLTVNDADDVKPAWSPDGTKIAFESYRDGQPEIYVMNADGSNQTRLTHHPDFDGMPAWSPDGQTIVFSSRRTGGYRIYTMDAATGANLTQRSDLPFSLFPVWSPSGEYIAFSADMNEDGWLGTVIIRASDNEFYSAIGGSFYDYTDLWVGGWHPTAENYALTVLTYRAGGGNVFLTQTELRSCPISVGTLSACPAFNHQDVASVNPDIRPDTAALPTVTMHPLPIYASSEKLYTVSWTSNKVGVDVQTVDLQYRVGENGSWTNWSSYHWSSYLPLVSSEVLTLTEATAGNTLYFRGRATDKHFVVGDWSDSVSTTFYGLDIRGQLLDNRGEVIRGMHIHTSPTPLIEGMSDDNGRYHIRSQTNAPQELTLAGMPSLEITAQGRRALPHAYLAPANNLMMNTHFENGATGWSSSATPRFNKGYTGQVGFTLGEPLATCDNCTVPELQQFPWRADFAISQTRYFFDQLGQTHLIFLNSKTLHNPVYHTQQILETGEWTYPEQIGTLSYISNSFLVSENNGTVHVLLNSNYYRREQGNWSEPEIPWEDMENLRTIHLNVDENGQAHVIALQSIHTLHRIYHFVRTTAGLWQVQTLHEGHSVSPIAFVTPKGDIHVFMGKIFHIIVRPDGSRTEDRVVLTKNSRFNFHELLYFAEDDSFFLRGYGVGSPISYSRYTAEDGWTKLQALPDIPEWSGMSTGPYRQAMTTGIFNDKVRLLTVPTQSLEVEWLEDYPRGEAHVTGTPSYKSDNWGNLQLVFTNHHYDLYYGPYAITAVSDQNHTLAQVITIPTDMPNPTVSLMYRTIRDIPGDETQFEVQLTNGVSTTTHVLPPTAVVWEHAWFDASEWAGETVTLTLTAVQKAGDPLIRVDVDDVSLGSAVPDTWVTLEAPSTAMPSEELTLSLNYGNFSPDLLAPTATLTLTLPAGLTVNSVSMTPTTQTAGQLVWQLGDLPANSSDTITLTVMVNADAPSMSSITAVAELRTPLTELSRANNSHTWPLFIGQRAYLPTIVR